MLRAEEKGDRFIFLASSDFSARDIPTSLPGEIGSPARLWTGGNSFSGNLQFVLQISFKQLLVLLWIFLFIDIKIFSVCCLHFYNTPINGNVKIIMKKGGRYETTETTEGFSVFHNKDIFLKFVTSKSEVFASLIPAVDELDWT